MQLIFLGTSSMTPTKERNQSSILLLHEGEGLLFDCGEGTQRQLKVVGESLTKITKIFLSHWHGDHVLGLPGLLQSLSASDYNKTLKIFGPPGTKEHMDHMFKAFLFDRKLDLEVHEVSSGIIVNNDLYQVQTEALQHNIKTQGYAFIQKDLRRINVAYCKKLGIPDGPLLGALQEGTAIKWQGKDVDVAKATKIVKGKKIAIVTDTIPSPGCDLLAKGADVLVCEATYGADLKSKAAEYMHMTAQDAAEIARKAGVKKLILTHFSARYKKTLELEEDASKIFDNVVAAEDLMKIKL